MTSYATTNLTAKAQLSREEFGLICGEAARSTDCADYIGNVLAGLCRWLTNQGRRAELPELVASAGNVQVLVVALYHLLEEKCGVDFDASRVLNAYAPPYQIEELL
ncbi:MAG TPA: hypothetical protein VJZ91_10330 [Blastocatellia bacterium]|nr:hypothetical protein [Blastocatellia bacterium]